MSRFADIRTVMGSNTVDLRAANAAFVYPDPDSSDALLLVVNRENPGGVAILLDAGTADKLIAAMHAPVNE